MCLAMMVRKIVQHITGCKVLVTLNYRTSVAHHDWFSTCTWPGGVS